MKVQIDTENKELILQEPTLFSELMVFMDNMGLKYEEWKIIMKQKNCNDFKQPYIYPTNPNINPYDNPYEPLKIWYTINTK